MTEGIVADRVEKLVAAGRPREIAEAEARIVAAFYDTWSQRMGGKLGTAREMYDRDAPAVQATSAYRAAKGKEPAMAQGGKRGGIRHVEPLKAVVDAGRKIIRLASEVWRVYP